MSNFHSSFIPNYQEEPFLNQLAQIAAQLGQQQYTWAQQQFANTSQLTDQAVQQYLQAATSADNLAQNNISRYEQVYQPLENQLIQDANSYSSPSRTAFEMGKAESGAGQAMDASRINAERQLQSFGVDPSSGRYAELEAAQNAQRGAAQAGAGQQAQFNTENTGRQLRSQAIQIGQQYPGQAVNALNAETQNLSGAVNAKLANLNSGVGALSSAVPFLSTGMGLKYPPLGSAGGSGGGFKVNNSPPARGGGSGGGGGNGSPAGYPGNINGPAGGYYGSVNPSYTSYQPSAGVMQTGGGYDTGNSGAFDTYGQDVGSYTNYDPNGYSQFADTSSQAMPGGGDAFNTYGQDYGAYTNYDPSFSGSSYDSSGSGLDYSGGGGYNTGGQDYGSYGDTSYSSDPTAGYSSYDSSGSGWGDSSGGSSADTSGWGDSSGGSSTDYSYGGYGYAAGGGVQPDKFGGFFSNSEPVMGSTPGSNPTASANPVSEPVMGSTPGSNPTASSTPALESAGGLSDPRAMYAPRSPYGVSLAAGGNPTTGGMVPQQASPSGGRLQDDVPANLNEGEFVVPRDVAMWKGQEFFQKMIDQARKARMGASAQGKPGPRQPGPPRFASQSMPQMGAQ